MEEEVEVESSKMKKRHLQQLQHDQQKRRVRDFADLYYKKTCVPHAINHLLSLPYFQTVGQFVRFQQSTTHALKSNIVEKNEERGIDIENVRTRLLFNKHFWQLVKHAHFEKDEWGRLQHSWQEEGAPLLPPNRDTMVGCQGEWLEKYLEDYRLEQVLVVARFTGICTLLSNYAQGRRDSRAGG